MENTNNSVVISLSERMKSLNPVDRVNEIAATVLYDPKHVESMTCYPAVRTYLTKVPGLNFILESEAKRKWKLSEILSEEEKEKCSNCPVYEFRFDDETMTMIVHREGDKKLRPIGLIVNHAVVLDTNMQYTCNARVEFEDKEFGVFEWFAKVKKEVINDNKEKSFFENFMDKQKENFKSMNYEEKFEKLKEKCTFENVVEEPIKEIGNFLETVVERKEDESFLTSLKETQIKNFKGMEYGKKLETVIGKDLTFESFIETHKANFKGMKYEEKFKNINKRIFGTETVEKKSVVKYVKNKEFDIEGLQDLLETFPESFKDTDGYHIANSLVKIKVDYNGVKFDMHPLPRYYVSECIHYTQAGGKIVYAIDGDWCFVESCTVSDDELAQLLQDYKEICKLKAMRELIAKEEEELLLAQEKERQYQLKYVEVKKACQGALYQRALGYIFLSKFIRQNKARLALKAEQTRIALEKEKQKEKHLAIIDNQIKINKEVQENALVLSPLIKKAIVSFKKEQSKLDPFGLTFVKTENGLLDLIEDPKQYKEFFIKKLRGYALNLDHPVVAQIQFDNNQNVVITE